jgi:N-methylhydantoinase A/oxoprolinase/acetone carboxylase beta subunit
MFGALVAERLGVSQAYAFDFGPVFGAFGSSISDVAHVYERGVGRSANDPATLAAALGLYEQAQRDLRGEGFDPDAAKYRYEIEEAGNTVRMEHAGAPTAAMFAAQGPVPVSLLRLTARFEVGVNRLQKREHRRPSVKPGSRAMQFNGRGAKALPAYVWDQLNAGEQIVGPAMINGATLTCPVPPRWVLCVDEYGNAALSRSPN